MKTVFHSAGSRGFADHDWLKSNHSFSFSGYYNPDRIGFGALRVLNDDKVKGGRGFGEHPHDNMEIISIPLKGGLVHMDSLGNSAIIRPGEVQAMSAGTGIYHTEYNQDENLDVEFLQIWLYPDKRNVTPRYDQYVIPFGDKNVLHQVLSSSEDDSGVWIHQQAWFHMGEFDKDMSLTYKMKNPSDGLYIFVIAGSVITADCTLQARDGLGIWEIGEVPLTVTMGSKVLLMEVPMKY
ncbi:pirin family protein [Mucilaginibacter terrenus]|nr:pirin family protein [Mucilaginibacter terrenus]